MRTLIKQASVLVKDNETMLCDILLENGNISKIANDILCEDAQIIDAKGLLALPGLIDVHVHLREPGFTQKETILTGTQAAAHGGFTTIMAMPNVYPYPDNVEVMKTYLKKIEQDACVSVIPYGCITNSEAGKTLSDMKGMRELGIFAFSDDGVGVGNEKIMRMAMLECKQLDAMIVAHTEDMSYRKKGSCIHEGIRNQQLGVIGIPSACEYVQLQRDLALAKETKCKYHVCHMSAKESVESLRIYKKMGVDCSGEVTAHHLLLTEMDVKDENYKMNPPLRSEEDRQALIQGLLDGTIDMIANDHAPHTEEDKKKGLEKSAFGIVALETAFPLLYTKFVKEQQIFTLEQLVYWMSEAPAKRFQLHKKGKLQEGYHADIILVDPNHYHKIHKDDFYSKGKNTPFDGVACCGFIQKTFVNGKCIYDVEKGVC